MAMSSDVHPMHDAAELPPELLQHAEAWLVWQPTECDGRHLFYASCWCATRRRDLSHTEEATPGIDRTVMRGTPEDLAKALAAQEARTARLIG